MSSDDSTSESESESVMKALMDESSEVQELEVEDESDKLSLNELEQLLEHDIVSLLGFIEASTHHLHFD